jgi:hypothetical protein
VALVPLRRFVLSTANDACWYARSDPLGRSDLHRAPVGHPAVGGNSRRASGWLTMWTPRRSSGEGFGLFYQPPFTEAWGTLTNSAPFSPQYMQFSVPFDNPWLGATNPFPAQYDGTTVPGKNAPFTLPLSVVSLRRDWRPARVVSWNLAIERQLQKDILLRVAYAASKGTFPVLLCYKYCCLLSLPI